MTEKAQSCAYDPSSSRADEFINHQEILDTLAFADEHKHDLRLIDKILDKAQPNLNPARDHCSVLSHRDAAVLHACDIPEVK